MTKSLWFIIIRLNLKTWGTVVLTMDESTAADLWWVTARLTSAGVGARKSPKRKLQTLRWQFWATLLSQVTDNPSVDHARGGKGALEQWFVMGVVGGGGGGHV